MRIFSENWKYFCYNSTCVRGVAQTLRYEILPSIGMLRGVNTAPAFTAPMDAKTNLILVVFC